jgi:hypothetical protein
MSMITMLMIHCLKYTRVSEFVDLRSHDSNIQERLLRCQTTNSPIRAWNIYESNPFSRKKFLSLCSIVKTTEWNGLIQIDN